MFIFVFVFIILGGGSEKILLQFISKSILLMLSSRRVIASGHMFRSLIHSEFIFVYGVRECYNFILLYVAVQFFQHHLTEETVFSPLYILAPLS